MGKVITSKKKGLDPKKWILEVIVNQYVLKWNLVKFDSGERC